MVSLRVKKSCGAVKRNCALPKICCFECFLSLLYSPQSCNSMTAAMTPRMYINGHTVWISIHQVSWPCDGVNNKDGSVTVQYCTFMPALCLWSRCLWAAVVNPISHCAILINKWNLQICETGDAASRPDSQILPIWGRGGGGRRGLNCGAWVDQERFCSLQSSENCVIWN